MFVAVVAISLLALAFGLLLGYSSTRFHVDEEPWQYLAVPGAVLYFNNNRLTITTRHFLIDHNFERISSLLQQQLLTEEDNLRTMKESLHVMENEILKRLWNIRSKTVR